MQADAVDGRAVQAEDLNALVLPVGHINALPLAFDRGGVGEQAGEPAPFAKRFEQFTFEVKSANARVPRIRHQQTTQGIHAHILGVLEQPFADGFFPGPVGRENVDASPARVRHADASVMQGQAARVEKARTGRVRTRFRKRARGIAIGGEAADRAFRGDADPKVAVVRDGQPAQGTVRAPVHFARRFAGAVEFEDPAGGRVSHPEVAVGSVGHGRGPSDIGQGIGVQTQVLTGGFDGVLAGGGEGRADQQGCGGKGS